MNIKRTPIGALLLLLIMWAGVFLEVDIRVIVASGFAAVVFAVFSLAE